jgi:sulfoxide reductase heme-binding subunit YedZ
MRQLRWEWIRLAVHVGALLPFARLAWDALNNDLTANPIKEATLRTGFAALVLLVLSLACTPVALATGHKRVLALRRSLGLYGFFYASIHLLIFLAVDYGFDLELILQDFGEKRFIIAGLAAYLLLVPLAITSTQGWVRRLGKRWRRLHRLVYLAVPVAVIHFVWLVKSDIRLPLFFGAVVALLLVVRLPAVRRRLINPPG